MSHLVSIIKRSLPAPLYAKLRAVWFAGLDTLSIFGPAVRVRDYCGMKLYYNRNNAIVKRLVDDPLFERALSKAIVRELSAVTLEEKAVFVDVGSNIGLISLYIASKLPSLNIHAFEPGMSQQHLFGMTIAANNLTHVTLHKIALADKQGTSDFHVHDPRYASHDGFKDTGRRGATEVVQVPVTTLDTWWIADGKPAVPVIKLDTEGAEILVLKGAETLLREAQPVVFLEIEKRNLKAYDFSYADIEKFFDTIDYDLTMLEEAEDTYVARPRRTT